MAPGGDTPVRTYPRLLSFEGTVDGNSATLDYRFEDSARYQVTITADAVALQNNRYCGFTSIATGTAKSVGL